MTAHWIDPISRERRRGVLACKRMTGKVTFPVLAKALEDIHTEFGIQNKVCTLFLILWPWIVSSNKY